MEDVVKLQCRRCQASLKVNRIGLSARWGQIVRIKCPRCSGMSDIRVDENLLKGAAPDPVLPTDRTMIIHQVDKTVVEVGKIEVIANAYHESQIFQLLEGENIIGRESINSASDSHKIQIKTSDTTISRNHCVIKVIKQAGGAYKYLIWDNKSTNGTHLLLSGSHRTLQDLDKVYIQNGDQVSLGWHSTFKLMA